MDDLKTQIHDSELNTEVKHTKNGSENSTPTRAKAPRGRPPGRRRENIQDSSSQVLPETATPSLHNDAALDPMLAPSRSNGRIGRVGRGRVTSSRVNNDKPIFTLSVAAEILHLHPRTLRIYEEHELVIPTRTQTNRRRYSQNDLKKFQFIQYLTRDCGVNLSGVKIILKLLEEIRQTVPDPIRHVFPEYGESEGFPLQ